MDFPRFEPVKGPPEQAHRHHHGGRLVDFIFRLIDRRRAKRSATQATDAQLSGRSPIEIQERPRTPIFDRLDLRPVEHPEAFDGLPSGPLASRDFLLGSAHTRRLQTALLVGLAVVLGVVLIQVASERTDKKILHAQQVAPGH